MTEKYESAIKDIDKIIEPPKQDKKKKPEERWMDAYT